MAAVCLSIGYPTIAAASYSIANGFKNLLAIAVVTDDELEEASTIKKYIKDPSKFAAAAAASAPAAAAGGAANKKVEAKKEESHEEEDDDMGFGFFDEAVCNKDTAVSALQ